MNSSPILFVHIPKTAGTSFKFSLKEYFKEKSVLSDYGPSSAETSKEILEIIYEKKDTYLLKECLKDKKVLLGHFGVGKYMHFFSTLNVATFLREPVSQVLSHYNHFKTHYGYDKDIRYFIQEERFKNLQTKYLQAKPLELFGFIGITERFDDSIELFNYYYNTQLKSHYANKATHPLNVDNEIIELIKQLNQKDIFLYNKAKEIFEKQWECYKKKIEYQHIFIQEENQEKIFGVAFKRESNGAIDIEINGFYAVAKDFRPGLLLHNLPRDSFVGFHIVKESTINKHLRLK